MNWRITCEFIIRMYLSSGADAKHFQYLDEGTLPRYRRTSRVPNDTLC